MERVKLAIAACVRVGGSVAVGVSLEIARVRPVVSTIVTRAFSRVRAIVPRTAAIP